MLACPLSQSAGSYDDMQGVATSSPRTQRPSGGGQAGSIRSKFENMASAEQEVREVTHVTCSCPGEKVRVITREARYYAKTRAFASFYAIISRAHAARAVT